MLFGTGRLIQNGAKLVLDTNDILCDFGIFSNTKNIVEEDKDIQINPKYQEIYKLISRFPINANELCKKTGKKVEEVNAILTMLELDGLIKKIEINKFVLN